MLRKMSLYLANKAWWVSWVHEITFGKLHLKGPWWCSNLRCVSDDEEHPILVAAAVASTELAAKEYIYRSYEERPVSISWKFCDEFDKNAPFSERYSGVYWSDFWEDW
jgi:hypothetical protein